MLTRMNFRVLCTLSLLLAGSALLPSPAAAVSVSIKSKLKYQQASSVYSDAAIAFRTARITSQIEQPGGKHDKSGTQIKQASNVAIHGSIVPACDAALSFIGVLRSHKADVLSQILEPPTRQVLFKVLFRTVIAPNAP
jgi:hypothetical protein